MQETWSYKNFSIKAGLKPGSDTFRYFFRVFDGDEKKCNYCVWITDEALRGIDPGGDFKAVAASGKSAWRQWVKDKIDGGDFRHRALKVDASGEREIDLSEMTAHHPVE